MRETTNKSPHVKGPKGCRTRILIAAFITMFAADGAAQQDIRFFNLTDVSGTFTARYWFDERSDKDSSQSPTAESTRWQEHLYVRTRSYIYHPAFLEMIISGGPTAVQSTSASSQSDDVLFGYDVTLNALARKAYPFTVFFRQAYPERSTGVSGRFAIESSEYGIQGRIRPRRSPVRASWKASRRDTFGAGFDAIVDNNADSASLNTTVPYKNGQSLSLKLNWDRTESRNGSPGLPLFETSSTTQASRLSGENVLGKRGQIKLRQTLTRLRQDFVGNNVTEVETLNYNGNLRWEHSDRHTSYGTYKFFDNERNTDQRRSQGVTATTNFRISPGLSLSGTGRFAKAEGSGFSQDNMGASVSANFGRQLPFGRLGLSGSLRMSRRDQQSTRDSSSIFDEPLTLAGVDPFSLQEDFVVVGSVIVTNADRTQTFIEDIDYRLVTIGESTTIERLVTGNVLDGEAVLVSYEYLIGGTVEYGRMSQSVSATLNMPRIADLFLSISNIDNEILSGTATVPLNDSLRFEFGASRGYALETGWSFRGKVRFVKQEEEISPFFRTSYEFSIGLPQYFATRVNLGALRELVDYETSLEDVDRVRYTINVSSRLPGRLFLNYRGALGENDGGRIFREDERHNLQLSWRYRQVTFSMNAIQSDVIQGDSRRKETRVTATVRRYF